MSRVIKNKDCNISSLLLQSKLIVAQDFDLLLSWFPETVEKEIKFLNYDNKNNNNNIDNYNNSNTSTTTNNNNNIDNNDNSNNNNKNTNKEKSQICKNVESMNKQEEQLNQNFKSQIHKCQQLDTIIETTYTVIQNCNTISRGFSTVVNSNEVKNNKNEKSSFGLFHKFLKDRKDYQACFVLRRAIFQVISDLIIIFAKSSISIYKLFPLSLNSIVTENNDKKFDSRCS